VCVCVCVCVCVHICLSDITVLSLQQRNYRNFNSTLTFEGLFARGGVVVKALRYKPAGRGFVPDCVTGIFQ
jgi:hypothetical protein